MLLSTTFQKVDFFSMFELAHPENMMFIWQQMKENKQTGAPLNTKE